jgi:hypothetical protein
MAQQRSRSGRERQVMGILQVPGHLRRAPLLALRAVFTGIGRVLMVADRPATAPAPVVVNGTAPASAEVTGSVRPATVPLIAGESGHVNGNESTVDLPLPNYDALTLASIRARLRGLDVAQLKVLLDYEAANAERTEVLGMFERRIEKLEAGA